jgi:hypothetical protein
LVILLRKMLVVSVGAVAYSKPLFAATATVIVLFVSYVMHKAYEPYRKANTDASELLLPLPTKLKCVGR